jgi:hypothetical protein
VAHVQKSGLSALDIDKLDRGELCDLLEAMGCPTDYTAARHHTKTDGGCNVDELRRAAKHMVRGACAVPGWCSADADAFTDSPMLNQMSFVRDSMHSSSSNSEHCALVVMQLEGEVVAAQIRANMAKIGCVGRGP